MLLMTGVLFAVRRINGSLPGLYWWRLAYVLGTLYCLNFLWRPWLPEAVSVLLAHGSLFGMAYLTLLGCRAYLGLPVRLQSWVGLWMVALVGVSLYHTLVQPNVQVRFLVGSWGSALFFLLSARLMAEGGVRVYPARYLYAVVAGAHGVFLLLRPLLFGLSPHALFTAEQNIRVSSAVVLESMLAVVMMAFVVMMLAHEFMTQELKRLAERDPLTGIFNRRAFITLLDKALSLGRRVEQPLSVVVVDIDHFKRINDTQGHWAGDDVLRHFIGVVEAGLRKEDVLGRLGGEEFAIIMPNTALPDAMAVSDRLRAMTAATPAVTAVGVVHYTVSMGVTLAVPGEGAEQVLHRADLAMYCAKHAGRDRVAVQLSGDPQPQVVPGAA